MSSELSLVRSKESSVMRPWLFSPNVFEHLALSDYIEDSHACLDIVHVDDILPFSPIEYLKIQNKYYNEWFQKDHQLWSSNGTFNSCTTKEISSTLSKIRPVKVHRATNQDTGYT